MSTSEREAARDYWVGTCGVCRYETLTYAGGRTICPRCESLRPAAPPAAPAPEREALLGKLDRAYAVVSAISQGRARWTMSVPARPESDPDLVISDALSSARKFIATAPAAPDARERLREQIAHAPH